MVLLALPPISAENPPLGIAYLKAHLEKSGIKTSCLDLNACQNLKLDKYKNAKYVGFSLLCDKNIDTMRKIAHLFKGILIAGGPCCKDKPDEIGKIADHIIAGAGEQELPRLLGREPYAGYLYPDYSDFDLSKYKSSNLHGLHTLPISSGRGCRRNCKFCNTRHYWPEYVARDGESIFEEMAYMEKKYNVIAFNFSDTAFNSNKYELMKLCQLIIKHRKPYLWKGYFILEEETTKEEIQMISRAGCTRVNIGLESGSERVRKEMGKPVSTAHVAHVLKALKHNNIHAHLLMIVGYPTEDDADFCETIAFFDRHRNLIDSVNIGTTCHICQNSYLDRNVHKMGINAGKDMHDWSYGKNTRKSRERRHMILRRKLRDFGIREISDKPEGQSQSINLYTF